MQSLEKNFCSCNAKALRIVRGSKEVIVFLLGVPYKILKRLIHAQVDPLLPVEQTGFQCERSTMNQAVLLI